VLSAAAPLDLVRLQALCRERMPAYMFPARFEVHDGPLPRNANGKIDRKLLSADFLARVEAL
jgi:acyl-CoA synthetase (AMP-forming)/AMP-acid ligase II